MSRLSAAIACLRGKHVVYKANLIIHGSEFKIGDEMNSIHPKDFKYIEINTINNEMVGVDCNYYLPESWAIELLNVFDKIKDREGNLPDWVGKLMSEN